VLGGTGTEKGILIIFPVPASMALNAPLVVALPMIKGVVVPPLCRIVTLPLPAPLSPALQTLTLLVQGPKKKAPVKRTRFPAVGSIPASIVTFPLVLPNPVPNENIVLPTVIPPPVEVRLTAPPLPPKVALDCIPLVGLNVIPPPVEVKLTAPPLPVKLEAEIIEPDVILPPVEVRLTAPPLPKPAVDNVNILLTVIFPPAEVRLTAPPLTFDMAVAEPAPERIDPLIVIPPPVEVRLIAPPLPVLEPEPMLVTGDVMVIPPPVEVRLIAPPPILDEKAPDPMLLAVIPPPTEVRVTFPPGSTLLKGLAESKSFIFKFPLLALRVIFPIRLVYAMNGTVLILRFGALILAAFIVILRPRVFS